MRNVTVVYHCEDGNWWADSPEPRLETFVAGGRSFEETRRLAWEGLEFHLEEQLTLTEFLEDGTPVDAPGFLRATGVLTLNGPCEILARESTTSKAVLVRLAPAVATETIHARALEVA